MVSRISSAATRHRLVAASALIIAAVAGNARATDPAPMEPMAAMPPMAAMAPAEKSPYSLMLSATASSHYINYGADTWGGGNNASPFSSRSTVFGDACLNIDLTHNLTLSLDLWSDINNNDDSPIGGRIQEIDFNAGLTYKLDKFAFTLSNGLWNYSSDQEKVADLTVAYDDTGWLAQGFALNPAVNVHWRYEGNNGQECGVALEPRLKPSFQLNTDSKYPLTISFPISIGFFLQDGFQGGDSGYGYASAGAAASVPLAFIPARYGAWSVSGSLTYYNTSDDAIPNNPDEDFFVTAVGISMMF